MEDASIDETPSDHSTLSRNDKAHVRRNVYRAQLNPNVNPFITIKNAPEKDQKKNPKGHSFWALVLALCIIAVANFLLTITIFSVLRLTKSMESIEVLPSINLVKFFGEINFERILKMDGKISGFGDIPVEVTSHGSDLNLNVLNEQEFHPGVKIGQDRVEFLNIHRFDIHEPKKTPKLSAFSTMFPNFGLPKGVQTLQIKKASASRITSRLDGALTLKSDSHTRLKGNEGVHFRGKEIVFYADQDLFLRSINGSMLFDAHDVILDINSIPAAPSKFQSAATMAQFKLCACMPKGNLFRIPVLPDSDTINCGSIDLSSEDSPCSL